MEHFITQIKIGKVRHLTDITIDLDAKKRQHLILTGKKWFGKNICIKWNKRYIAGYDAR